jgi:type II secretory pathway pseudopilin PulG
MIELIFVIVIIGILAAVAIPKLAGVQGQAQAAKIAAYAGTLQRTTIPPYWSQSILAGTNGEINATMPGSTTTYSQKILEDLDYPTDFNGAGATAPTFVTATLEAAGYDFNATGPGTKIVAKSVPLNGVTYKLVCSNGNRSTAPTCDVWDGTKWILKSNR